MSEIIVLRTHYYDRQVDKWVRYLQSRTSRVLVAVVDERKAPVAIPPDITKISLDPKASGLLAHPDYGWRCGDYAVYAAAQAVPSATSFWVVEPDVRIHAEAPEMLLDGVAATQAADFVTAWFVQSSPEWSWHSTIAPFADHVFNCMLQLYRISRPAVSYLLEKRIALSQLFLAQGRDIQTWPNDEAFMGAMIATSGLRVATFKTHAPAFRTDKIFSFTKPTSQRWLDQQPYDNGVYHPVVQGAKFRARLLAHLGVPDRDVSGPNPEVPGADQAMLAQLRIENSPLAPDRVPAQAATAAKPALPPPNAGAAHDVSGDGKTNGKKAVPIRCWNRIRNNGDAITSIILDELFALEPYHEKESEPHVLGVGSIMFMANRHSIIWGCGVLNEVAFLPEIAPRQIRALRGKKSADFLTRKGVALGQIAFGDPGILVDRMIIPQAAQRADIKHRVAVVPHHDSVQHPLFDTLRQRDDVCIVDMLDDGITPIRQIAEAQIVVSQSLHGLIYAEALGKPSVWIAARSDDIWNFKFDDWFTTTRNPQRLPVMMDRPFEAMLAQAEAREMTDCRKDLIDAFPTELVERRDDIVYGYADCRAASPLTVFMPKQHEPTSDFDAARDMPALDRLSQTVRSMTASAFSGWAERPYTVLASIGSKRVPTPAQARAIAHAMDERSGIDYAFVVEKLSALPKNVTAIELPGGVVAYRGYKALGEVIFLRPTSVGLKENFIVFGI